MIDIAELSIGSSSNRTSNSERLSQRTRSFSTVLAADRSTRSRWLRSLILGSHVCIHRCGDRQVAATDH